MPTSDLERHVHDYQLPNSIVARCHCGAYLKGHNIYIALKHELAEVTIQRDALREQNAALLEVLNCYALGKKTCGHGFVCICNQVKAEELIAKIEGREINPWWRDSPEK